jgi:hypothetical protein
MWESKAKRPDNDSGVENLDRDVVGKIEIDS